MNLILRHIADGGIFFTGGIMLILAAGMGQSSVRIVRRAAPLTIILGAIFVVISSTPLSPWWYGLLAITVIA